MTVRNSSQKGRRNNKIKKPKKPRKDFPLFAHSSGQWAKKVKGRMVYFGTWDDPASAEARWDGEKCLLLAGEERKPADAPYSITELCGEFLASKQKLVKSNELSEHTFGDYLTYCRWICDFFGEAHEVENLLPSDFAKFRMFLAKPKATKVNGKTIRKAKAEVSLKSLETRIAYCRAVFNFGEKNGLLNVPLRKLWGTEFDKPGKKALRIQKKTKGAKKLVTASELNRILEFANPNMKAMVLLGVNCGFGNTDVAMLKFEHIDLKKKTISMERSKTGKDRKAFLWPETIAAMEDAEEFRKKPNEQSDSDYFFITQTRKNWIPRKSDNPVSKEFAKIARKAKVKRPGLSFYALRHTFQTLGDESGDYPAVKFIMGHAESNISDEYRESVSDARLRKVANSVRKQLFPKKKKKA